MNVTPTHLAIVHSHFEPGDVTDAVRHHVARVRDRGDGRDRKIVLLSGNRVAGLDDPIFDQAETIQIRDLDHDPSDPSTPSLPDDRFKGFRRAATGQASLAGRDLYERVDAALRRAGLLPDNSLIHWHNASLGKNAAVPFVVSHLANSGWRLLLQIHDLDADQDPVNIRHLLAQTGATRASTLDAIRYPVHGNIAYICPVATDQDPPRRFVTLAPSLPEGASIVGCPPGDSASREAAVNDALHAPD
ncbi:hypothetical protein [Allorhodopirellula heiligendammensis]|uniref:Uncharacterized protein n=1 Tax=Allorhodopirellula heiligendammensis TaxID=2714739 RepID=A0A5C6C1X4_9BACT|nr:hypothetical protein [Allorhodopirellula heiligendammensis]TWU18162.1 hypothetical protein Poly21_03170 [Allorhodopirellula heiligendammensis]